jgi:hypothetical protein
VLHAAVLCSVQQLARLLELASTYLAGSRKRRHRENHVLLRVAHGIKKGVERHACLFGSLSTLAVTVCTRSWVIFKFMVADF